MGVKVIALRFRVFFLLSFLLAAPAYADSGALYEAWETGEEVVTNQSSSLITGGFFYSPEEGLDAQPTPPPPRKARWERFKSLEEQGEVPRGNSEYNQLTAPIYDHNNHSSDPFANRINDIESLLSGQ
jgi:hypothetical protein